MSLSRDQVQQLGLLYRFMRRLERQNEYGQVKKVMVRRLRDGETFTPKSIQDLIDSFTFTS
jgi:hypothetical protein